MAIARCVLDAPKKGYKNYIEPVGHPNSALICGKMDVLNLHIFF